MTATTASPLQRRRPLTDKQQRDVADAESHAEAAVQVHALLSDVVDQTRAAAGALSAARTALRALAPGAERAGRESSLPALSSIAGAVDTAERAIGEIDETWMDAVANHVEQLEESHAAHGGSELREAIVVRVLKTRGWSQPRIAYELIDWDAVASDRRGWDVARRSSYRAAMARITRYDSAPVRAEGTGVHPAQPDA